MHRRWSGTKTTCINGKEHHGRYNYELHSDGYSASRCKELEDIAGWDMFLSYRIVGVVTQVYYPQNNSPKLILLVAGIAGYVTSLLAKD